MTLRGLFGAAMAGAGAATLLAFGGRWWWALDLFSHFRPQLMAVLLAGAAVYAVARRRRAAAVCAALAALNAAQWMPCWWRGGPAPDAPAGGVRLVVANVLSSNRGAGRLVELVRARDPDLVLLLEVNERWMRELAVLQAAYPFRAGEAREDNFGILLLSRVPLRGEAVVEAGPAGVPSVYAEFDLDGRPVSFLGTHPLPPAGWSYTRLRDAHLFALPGLLAERARHPVIVAGDLNAAPWSYALQGFCRQAGLRRACAPFRVHATWPSFAPAPLRIPLDHVLLGEGLAADGIAAGPPVGSDHLPVSVRIAWAAEKH